MARLIHAQGPRAAAAFVPVNCGAIPSELMESEFFGHRKGSFTGALEDKPGLFRAADGGTLFLDEVADLPLPMQVKLLRAIQEKAVRSIGGQQEVAVDVRLLCATHKDLAGEVAAGRFRQDLYYRLNVIELRVPPLRERREDIALLAEHCLQRLAAASTSALARLTPEALARLQGYRFPGNVRELENMLERGHPVRGRADRGRLHASWRSRRRLRRRPARHAGRPRGIPENASSARRSCRALEETRWNRTAAAQRLGLSFRSMRYRLKKLGIDSLRRPRAHQSTHPQTLKRCMFRRLIDPSEGLEGQGIT